MLRDVILEMRRGQILGLVEQSGFGKSTLALAVYFMAKPPGSRAASSFKETIF